KDKLPPDLNPAVGMKLMSTTESGENIPITVSEVGDDYIIIDANHELAGKDLIFDIKVVEIN
ncbi:peptidylprolyl isomerase, partial [Bacteroidota bacterium]